MVYLPIREWLNLGKYTLRHMDAEIVVCYLNSQGNQGTIPLCRYFGSCSNRFTVEVFFQGLLVT